MVATSAASRTHAAKSASSVITWSAAKDPISASGSSRSSRAAASPIAAMESRGDGSATTRSTWGSWRRTSCSCAAPVTTTTRSPTTGASRSTVAWISVRPVPPRSSRNFGRAARDNGHRRVPAPPAGTTAHSRSVAGGLGTGSVMARILPPRPGVRVAATVEQMTTPRTFPELVTQRLRTDPGQPLVTAYDDASGERTELSVTTYANWVNKTANLLTEELDLEAGDTLLLDLPAHWLVPVFLGAAWSAGIAVTDTPEVEHSVVVCGPDTVAGHRGADVVVACSLRPFAVRFPEPLPEGVLDYGLLWPGQSDYFLGLTPPTPDTVAWVSTGRARTQSELLEAAGSLEHQPGVRLLTDLSPAAEAGVPAFLAPLVHGGSLVLLRHAADATWPARHEDERATAELRGTGQPASE